MVSSERREGRMRPSRVSPEGLTSFIRANEATLAKLPKRRYGGYDDIFDALRTFLADRQEQLLVTYFTKEVNFPNGEQLGQFLAKLNNIPWYQPVKEPDIQELQQASDESYRRLDLKPLPVRLVKDGSYNSAEYEEWHGLFENVKRDPLLDAIDYAMNKVLFSYDNIKRWPTIEGKANAGFWMAWYATLNGLHRTGLILSGDAMMDPINYASMTAKWIVLKDGMAKEGYTRGNPGEPLFNGIFDKGFRFMGSTGKNSVVMNLQPFLAELTA